MNETYQTKRKCQKCKKEFISDMHTNCIDCRPVKKKK